MDILFNLYDKFSVGGICIIDDYGIAECQKAVTEFRKMHDITDAIKWNHSHCVNSEVIIVTGIYCTLFVIGNVLLL